MNTTIQPAQMSLVKFLDELLYPHEMWIPAEGARSYMGGPRVDLYPLSDESGLELKADLPGMSKEDITLELQGQTLTLCGERKSETVRDEENWHYAERRFGKFSRRFKLPYSVDLKTVSAKFEDGVLTVGIPKPEGYNPTGKITIN